jgi:PTH1 family peptidyl-tRNA hydrolase
MTGRFRMVDYYLIVGLGNPGARYEKTRHNVGFRCLDALAQRHGLGFAKHEHKAQIANGTILGKRVLLAKPQTFMNLSGESVGALASFYKVPHERILVVCDDMDIPLGTLRLRKTGSSGGQRGMGSILQRLGTQAINRVRFGIGRPPGQMKPSDYVLTPFKGDDEILVLELIDRTVKAVESWLTDGIEMAMNRYNGSAVTETATKPPTSGDTPS